jgi:uncharacterized protein YigE (DUF2233 family)
VRTFLLLSLIATTALAQSDKPSGDCATSWKHVGTGLDYRAIKCLGDEDDLDVHVVRIDPQFFNFDIAFVTNGSTARHEAVTRDARFVINANFFDGSRRPLGVLVRSGSELQGRHAASWQSIFLVDDEGEFRVIRVTDWPKYRSRARMAVQAGPRLVVKGKINKVNRSYSAARAGVCIQRDGDLVFFATPQDRKFDMWEIGRVAKRAEASGGLACYDSMLFDGGHSTQIYLEGDDKTISVSGDPVPVFVVAKRK